MSNSPTNTKASIITRFPLASFFILAYGITWLLWGSMIFFSLDIHDLPGNVINVLAIFGPTLAAIILTTVLFGRQGLSELLNRLLPSGVNIRWFAVAWLLPFIIISVAILVGTLLGSSAPTKALNVTWLMPLLVEAVRIFFFGGPLGEEIGWRGFALPRILQSNTSTMKSSMILGLLWGAWHAPIYFVAGTGQNELIRSGGSFAILFAAFVAWVMGMTVIFTWLYKTTNGNLLIALLLHTAINTAVAVPSFIGAQSGMIPLLNAGLTWVFAIIISRTKIFRNS